MTSKELKKLSLLAEISSCYYEKHMTQAEIADIFCLSRTRISRLLKEAVDKDVVHITINYTYERQYDLEERFKERFRLKDVYILNTRGHKPDRLKKEVGALAAKYLTNHIKKNMVIGTSWGTTVADAVTALDTKQNIPVDIVQLMGSIPCETPNCTPQEIVAGLAEAFSGKANFLNTPLYIEDDYVRKTICSDANNAKIINKGIFSDLILTGISGINKIKDANPWLDYMSDDLYDEILKKDAIGAICGRFFDRSGKEVDCRWNRNCVSISLKHLLSVPSVVTVASSAQKSQAILTAIRANFINVLITDEISANSILELDKEEKRMIF